MLLSITNNSNCCIQYIYICRTGFSPRRHEERDTILTMLTYTKRTAHLLMFKISVRRDLQNLNTCLNGRRFTALSPWSNLNWLFFKILKFSGTSLPGMTSSTLQSHFLSGGLLRKCWLSYPLSASVNCTNWQCTWTLKAQLNWMIRYN